MALRALNRISLHEVDWPNPVGTFLRSVDVAFIYAIVELRLRGESDSLTKTKHSASVHY